MEWWWKAWEEVRGDDDVDWLIAGFNGNSKTDITVLLKGKGGVDECSKALPANTAIFGGCRLSTGRFVTFFYADEGTPTMQKGRASMYKNGVLNVLEGSDCEIKIKPGLTENETVLSVVNASGDERANHNNMKSHTNIPKKVSTKNNDKISQASPETEVIISPTTTTVISEEQDETPNPSLAKQPTNSSSDTEKTLASSIVRYDQIKDIQDPSLLPSGVDPLHRELSLSNDEFIQIFGMDKSTFHKLPKWKQTSQKKAKGLFWNSTRSINLELRCNE